MTTTLRQTNLILNQDWTRIYQTFKNADFKSYDFENLRRVIITYLRENYPEDFNDYIESSEYIALIDAIAFLGQSLAFRIDLASRENFIELASRRDSVLRIARMLSYNPKRNVAAKGILKFDTISTTEPLLDNNGRNLARQTIIWNDSSNPNWQEQFIAILNAAMTENTQFGRSQGSAIIQGIPTEQYRFNTASPDVPIFSFEKNVAARSMPFELVSTSFIGSEELYEEAPRPRNQLGFIYRNDGKGAASANTGFYLLFKQGSLELADFNISVPSTNEKVTVDAENINNDDLWLFQLNGDNIQTDEWTKVSSLVGNNIAFNSIEKNIRNIYSVVTKNADKVELIFADGVYGNLPQGPFRVYYRVSNGLSYSILPAEMRGISIEVPYVSRTGALQFLTITMSLKYTVSNSAETESTDSIRERAPAVYYTQNRMITAEDYNLAPLSTSQDILKIRAINRTSSGISRNFDIIDATGKYSSVNVFADDGVIYKQESEKTLSFKIFNRLDVINFIRRSVEPLFDESELYNFYFTKYEKIFFTDGGQTRWVNVSSDINEATGYFINNTDRTLQRAGSVYTSSTLKFLANGSMIKFVPPEGKRFKKGSLVNVDINDPDQTDYIWTKVVRVVGDGTNAGRGVLNNGKGPITFSDDVPTDSIASRIIPKFINNLSPTLEEEIVNLCIENKNFGLRYDVNLNDWRIISSTNLDLVSPFSLGRTGDISNSNLDNSWILSFVKEADEYIVRVRELKYIFRSVEQNRFYYDSNQRIYDAKTGKVIKDQIRVLGINTDFNEIDSLKQDLIFEVDDAIRYPDGFQSVNEVELAFSDKDIDGIIDDPDSFERIVGLDQNNNYVFFKENIDIFGNVIFDYVDNSNDAILIRQRENQININDFADGTLIYFFDPAEDFVKRVNKSTNTLELDTSYKASIGRAGLKFQYIHHASATRRIDPSVSNIVDVYILTKSYDTVFRQFLQGATSEPEAPNSDSLRISFGQKLSEIKAISDEIIYHPVKYKVLFGATADPALRAQFKVVKNPNRTINDNDLKVKIIFAINEFFDASNWDFGDRFYLGELITYITNAVTPDISNLVIVPRQPTQTFGSLFEIQSSADEIFVSGATVDDIEIVQSISTAEIRVLTNRSIGE
jgi:hypothetical protein